MNPFRQIQDNIADDISLLSLSFSVLKHNYDTRPEDFMVH